MLQDDENEFLLLPLDHHLIEQSALSKHLQLLRELRSMQKRQESSTFEVDAVPDITGLSDR